MRFGISAPNFDDPTGLVQLAIDAEAAGWDGFFLWDHVKFLPDVDIPLVDAWTVLSAIAVRTERIKLGPMVTALPRRRPWKVARESVTLDHLSHGRLILGVGAGWPADGDFEPFGEDPDLATRAAKLDEGLWILEGLWSGAPFSFAGRHYEVSETTFSPAPLHEPRIPVWVAATWPARRPIQRAAKWDGVVLLNVSGPMPPLDEVTAVSDQMSTLTHGRPRLDVVIAGTTPPDAAAAGDAVRRYATAGATWWLETTDGQPGWDAALRDRIRAGPPQLRDT